MNSTSDSSSPPAAHGRRLAWSGLPERVLRSLEGWMGSRVERAEGQQGGFSPGVAARVTTAGGKRFFVKAAGPEILAGVPDIFRQEARVVSGMPPDAPVPRLLWKLDEGPAGWVALVYECIDGAQPSLPWQPAELARVLKAMADLSTLLTPSPLLEGIVPRAEDTFRERLGGWALLAKDPPAALDDWSARWLERLVELEARAPQAVHGDTLLHFDLRADNMLLTPDRVWFVDWPLACVGAPWMDALFFAPSVEMQGGPPPEVIMEAVPSARLARAEDMIAAVAETAGFFTQRALLPEIPALPGLRAFQAAQGAVARLWLARLTGMA